MDQPLVTNRTASSGTLPTLPRWRPATLRPLLLPILLLGLWQLVIVLGVFDRS